MAPLIASIFDVSPWERIKASMFPKKKESKLTKDKIELQCNIIMDLSDICRNREDLNDDGFVFGKDEPFKNVIIKGKNCKLWRVYFIGSKDSYVVFPYDSSICIQKLLNGSNGQYYINDVYSNHRWVYELSEQKEMYSYIYDWIEKNTNYHDGTYNPSLSDDAILYYKLK